MRTVEEIIYETMITEGEAIIKNAKSVSNTIDEAVNLLESCKGRIIFMGVGKSGHIGKKMAATFASLGIPAFFVHSTEALHGDLGMITENDVTILISNSGETQEVLAPIQSIKRIGAKIVAFTSQVESTMAREADAVISYVIDKEADHLGLAPTVSSTMTLVIGDAIANALSERRNFTPEDFHLYHPGGSLGAKLKGEKV